MGYNSVNFGFLGGSGGGSGPGSSVSFAKEQFEVGQVGSPMVQGDTVLTITVSNGVSGSELVFLGSDLLQPDLTEEISYSVTYSATEIVITFTQGVVDGQKYMIQYAYTS
jgi:hypothetical protein